MRSVCLKVNQKVRRRMGGRVSFAWQSRINELGKGWEEDINN
jgi:hypothetical protein